MRRHHIITLAWLAISSPAIAAQGSGCLPTTGQVSGLSMTQKINDAMAAVTSFFSGASPPATDCTGVPVKGQGWLDTSVTPNVERRYDGTNWVAVGAIDSVNHVWSPPVGGGSAAVTAASTTDICAAPAALQTISGTTTITSFGAACPAGVTKKLLFSAATPITYNATSMILPGQRDYTASAGDMADALHLGSGNWRVAISRIDGSSVINTAIPLGTAIYGAYGAPPAKTVYGIGQALSRATYPDYFAAVTRTQTGTLTSGNNTITSVANTSGLGVGMPIEGTGIPSGTTIASVTSSTIVMSSPNTATVTGSQTVRAFIAGYGAGGDSTTVGVQDCRGRMMAGRDDMGGTAVNRMTASYFGAGNRINASGGVEGYMIPQSALPNVNLPLVGTSGGQYFLDSFPSQLLYRFADVNYQGGGSATNLSGAMNATALSVTIPNPTGNTRLNGNVPQTGTSNIQPTVIAECVVAVLP
ncbi:hypothetical protein [Tardiphaga sp. 285_C5_N1_2]|uniref:hypothetical protein n=1 Tax=Tardiphaga sp. 285_C5_N1_2 TaxID=3240775 RepID=UPI003F8C06AA